MIGSCEALTSAVGILAGLRREISDLVPGLLEGVGTVEIGEPTVAGGRRALQDLVDIAADEDRHARLLIGLGIHDRGGNVVVHVFAVDLLLGP